MVKDRVTEEDVAIAVVKLLADIQGNSAEISHIIVRLPEYLALSEADRKRSSTRQREELWEQQVRNIVSHRDTPGNFIYRGLLIDGHRRLRLTDAGRAYAATL